MKEIEQKRFMCENRTEIVDVLFHSKNLILDTEDGCCQWQ